MRVCRAPGVFRFTQHPGILHRCHFASCASFAPSYDGEPCGCDKSLGHSTDGGWWRRRQRRPACTQYELSCGGFAGRDVAATASRGGAAEAEEEETAEGERRGGLRPSPARRRRERARARQPPRVCFTRERRALRAAAPLRPASLTSPPHCDAARSRHLGYLPLTQAALACHSDFGCNCLYETRPAAGGGASATLLVSMGAASPDASSASGAGGESPCVDFAGIVREARDCAAPLEAAAQRIRLPAGAGEGGGWAEAPLLGRLHENAGPCSATALVQGQPFLVPPRSAFALSDAATLPKLLPQLGTFDLIVIDPPWCDAGLHGSATAVSRWSRLRVPCPRLGSRTHTHP